MRHVPPSRKLVFSIALLLASVLAAPPAPRAADQKAALAKVKARYQAAAAAYDDGELEKVEAQLQQALQLAEENGLTENKVIAQAYVLYGVLEVAGLKNTKQGVKYFAKAIEISPAIQVPPTMASKAVVAAFDRAENQESEPAPAQAEGADDSQEAKPSKPSKATGRAAKAQQAPARDAESEKLADDLAASKVSESLQQAEAQRLQKEKQEQDKELASAKGHAQELAKQKAEQERQIADAKSKLQNLDAAKQDRDKQIADLKAQLAQLTKEKQAVEKQLATSQASEKKEREASNKLAQDKSQSDGQLGDSKRSLQDLAKQKAEVDRQLAAALADAKKEREAKEKLAAARREADARENERKNKELEQRTKLDKLAEGPDLPAHVTEPIACTIPDEIPPGADLYVHCVPRPGVDAKVVALYYRAGGVIYNVSTMDRSKKGWFTALIPGGKIAGKVLHYYVEARDGRSAVVGSNGRAASPNVATIRAGKR